MALTINIWCRFETVDAKGVRYRGGKKTTETPLTITTSLVPRKTVGYFGCDYRDGL